jgi:hypothetical protein
MKEKYVLKETKWYLLKAKDVSRLKAQAEEGISEVAWFDRQKLQKIKNETYPSVKIVTETYEKTQPAGEAG